jgi:hypothetical protein
MREGAFAVLAILEAGRPIRARLVERADGDVCDFSDHALLRASRTQEVLDVLAELEQHGVVARSETPHPFDTNEYCVEWRLLSAADPLEFVGSHEARSAVLLAASRWL